MEGGAGEEEVLLFETDETFVGNFDFNSLRRPLKDAKNSQNIYFSVFLRVQP